MPRNLPARQRARHPMNEDQAWVQWWASPWICSPPEWGAPKACDVLKALYRSQHLLISNKLEITPCLPPSPNPALLRLVLASPEQRDFMLALIEYTCRPMTNSPLNDDHRLWCQRLAKALHPDSMLSRIHDPLQLLQAWVDEAVWQRLRLSFARQRVIELEQRPRLTDAHGRLDTLWQAAIWRATSMIHDDDHRYPPEEDHSDVMPAQD